MRQHQRLSKPGCDKQIASAERELAAFMSAVSRLYGPEYANVSAQHWIDALELMDGAPSVNEKDWRTVTVAAISRLAERLHAEGKLQMQFRPHGAVSK